MYSPAAVEHIRTLDVSQKRNVLVTRNRKPMRPNPVAPWELRVGQLRVYYEIEAAEAVVRILAVGMKERNVIRIGKEIIEL